MENKIIVVTGASSGVGRALALKLAEAGASVVAAARRTERLEELCKEAEALCGKIVPYKCDVSVQEQAEGLVDYAVKEFGRIDVLINNAGLFDGAIPVGELTDAKWEQINRVNIDGPFWTIRRAVNYMREQKNGNIVNVVSVAGLYGCRGGAAYTAAKSALAGLTRSTAFMYLNDGIRCNGVCPGAIMTEILTHGVGYEQTSEFGQARVQLVGTSCPGVATAEDIANVAIFLASDKSKAINGAMIVADCGWTAG